MSKFAYKNQTLFIFFLPTKLGCRGHPQHEHQHKNRVYTLLLGLQTHCIHLEKKKNQIFVFFLKKQNKKLPGYIAVVARLCWPIRAKGPIRCMNA